MRITLVLATTIFAGAMMAQHSERTADVSTGIVNFEATQPSIRPHNAASCAECHSVPINGGSSPVTVMRVQPLLTVRSRDPEGSVILHAHCETSVTRDLPINGLRVATNLLGDGYVEAVPDQVLQSIAKTQRKHTHGVIHGRPELVSSPDGTPGLKVVGRFGWKSQHGSLVGAVADALNSELGIPNTYFHPLTHSIGPQLSSGQFDALVADDKISSIVAFLRTSSPISPDKERANSEAAVLGEVLFKKIGCEICHVQTLVTAHAGAALPGQAEVVPEWLGNRSFHPYSDFLLHDVGTGDGVVQNAIPRDYDRLSANKFRTAPLWGLRYRTWLMHDGKSVTYHQAIMRHSGEASGVVAKYEQLTPVQKEQLGEFLGTL